MTTTILSIDPATCTGWAMFEIDRQAETVTLKEYGAVEVDKRAVLEGDRMLSLRHQVAALIDRQTPEHVHIETYFFNRRTCNGSDVNVLLRGAIYQLLCERKIGYTLHAPTHWKKFIGGTAVPRKSDIEKFGKARAGKAYIAAALGAKFGIHFPSHTRIGGRRLTFKSDISDAVGIGLYGILCNAPTCRVQPNDARDPEITVTLGTSDEPPLAAPASIPPEL